MCCSQSFIKHILSFFSFITTGIGLAGIIFGTIGLVKIGGFDFKSWNWAYFAPLSLLCLGIVAFIIGLVGIIGASKKNKCCLCIYQFSIFPLVILGLATAIFATICAFSAGDLKDNKDKLDQCTWRQQTDSEDCKACGNTKLTKWVKNANDAVWDINNNVWGKSESCMILVNNEQQKQQYLDWLGPNTMIRIKDVDADWENAVSTADDCELTSKQQDWANFMSILEENFDCAGLCGKTEFYSFKDSTIIPSNPPTCYHELVKLMSQTLVLVISWSVFAYFLLNLTLACCLCCHPDRRKSKQGEPIYERMNYYD